MIRPAMAAAGLLLSTASPAQLALKDFTLGDSLEEAARRNGMQCRYTRNDLTRFCFHIGDNKPDAIRTIAGVPAKNAFISAAEDGKIGSVRYLFNASDFAVVKGALQEKYPDLRCQESVVQNRMGASFEQTVCRHSSPDGDLEARRRSSDLTEGSIEITSHAFTEALRRAAQRMKSEGKKDL